MTTCPACDEVIRAEARKCRRCQAWFEPRPGAPAGEWLRWLCGFVAENDGDPHGVGRRWYRRGGRSWRARWPVTEDLNALFGEVVVVVN